MDHRTAETYGTVHSRGVAGPGQPRQWTTAPPRRMQWSIDAAGGQEETAALSRSANTLAYRVPAISSSSPTATTADISGEKKEEVVAKESKSTTEIAVGAASAGVGKVSDETRAKMLKAAEDNAPKKSREEVLKGYKEEHRRMRAQMKAKLKAEYMNRLRRDREQKKKKLAAKKIIEGE